MEIEIAKELVVGGLAAAGGMAAKWAYDWYKSPERASKKAEAVGKASEKRDEALARRAEDKYVLKEVCEKCEETRKSETSALRDFLHGVNEAVREVRTDIRETRDDMREIRNHLITKGG